MLGDQAILKTLTERDRFVLLAGLAAVMIFALLKWGVFPALDQRDKVQRQVTVKISEVVELKQLQTEYEQMQSAYERSRNALRKRPAAFSLFSYLDALAGQTGLKNKIAYMKPTTLEEGDTSVRLSRVEMKLEDVTLDQVSRFIFQIEMSPNIISVPRLALTRKTQGREGTLEVVLQVETPEV